MCTVALIMSDNDLNHANNGSFFDSLIKQAAWIADTLRAVGIGPLNMI